MIKDYALVENCAKDYQSRILELLEFPGKGIKDYHLGTLLSIVAYMGHDEMMSQHHRKLYRERDASENGDKRNHDATLANYYEDRALAIKDALASILPYDTASRLKDYSGNVANALDWLEANRHPSEAVS